METKEPNLENLDFIDEKIPLERDETVVISKPLLSICTISSTKDKKERLKIFLENLPKAPEIELIFVETISREYLDEIPNKVIREDIRFRQAEYYYYTNIMEFDEARNYAKSLATGDWIMVLDMDEYLPSILIPSLLDILNRYKNSDYLAVNIGVASSGRNFKTHTYERIHTEALRIFKNLPLIKFYGHIHETIVHCIPEDRIIHSGLTINHFGYDVEKEDIMAKFDRNLKGLCKTISEDNYPTPLLEEYFFDYLDMTIQAIKNLKE